MRSFRRVAVASLLVTLALLLPRLAGAQATMVESGFICVLLSDDLAKQAEIGTGADTCLYYGSNDGLKRRCNPFVPATICDPSITFPSGIAFSTGGSFGSYFYVADFGLNGIYRSVGCAPGTLFASIFSPGAIAFPPSGSAYGDFLYACEAYNGPIKRVSSTGIVTNWTALATTYLRFGPGGTWGQALYATDMGVGPGTNRIVTVSSGGAIATVASSFGIAEGFDWAFDGDLFATDVGTGTIYRVKLNGTKTVFATLPGAADVAWRPGEQALYAVSNQGGLYRITRAGTTAVPPGARLASGLRVSPNPAASACTIGFSLATAGMVRVQIVDATGRRVRQLATAWHPAGAADVAWDGRDDAGAAARPGVYFARIASRETAETARITLVR